MASYPSFALLLEPLQSQLTWLPALFAVAGVVIVAWPFERAPQLSKPLALALSVLTLINVGALWIAIANSGFFGVMMIWLLLTEYEAPLLGVIVTTMSLWRRRKWFAGVWIAGWTTTISLIWLATSNSGSIPAYFGIAILFNQLALFASSLLASIVAFLLIELKTTMRVRGSRILFLAIALLLLVIAGFLNSRAEPNSREQQQSKNIVQPKISAASRQIVKGKFAFLTRSNKVVIKSVGDSSTSTIYKFAKNEEVDDLEFSPDGNKLLLIGYGPEPDLKDINFVYDMKRKKLRTLPDPFNYWYGDNQLIEGGMESAYYDLEKNRYIKIAPDVRDYVSWVSKESQDGERIIITNSDRAGRVLVGTKGNWRQLKKSFKDGDFLDAAWIGKDRVGIMDNKDGDAPEELLIFDKETGKLVQRYAIPGNLSGNLDDDIFLDSSPDGSQLLFVVYDGQTDKDSTWLMDSKTGKKRKLLEDSLFVLNWLPDNRHFLALKGENDVWLADIEAKKVFNEKLLTYSGEFIDWTPY